MKQKNIWKIFPTWLVLLIYIYFYIMTSQKIDFLYLFMSIYLLFLGSFICLKLPKSLTSSRFFDLSAILSITFLFLYSEVSMLNIIGIILLGVCPVLLYLLIYAFVQSQNQKLFVKSLFILVLASIISCFSFLFRFYAEVTLLALLIITIGVSYNTIHKERRLFYDLINFKILSVSILLAFVPFLLSYSLPILFSNGERGQPEAILLMISLPTCIAYILIYSKISYLTKTTYLNITTFFLSICFFTTLNFFNLPILKHFIITLFFALSCYIYQFFGYFFQTFEKNKIKKEMQELNNEQIEVSSQVTYAYLFNELSEILLNQLRYETRSSSILVLMESKKETFTICRSGKDISQKAKKFISKSFHPIQVIKFNEKTFYFFSTQNSYENLYLFFEKNNALIDKENIRATLEQYLSLLVSLRKTYKSHEKYIESSLDANQLVQMKLFNSIEKEKTKYTHYLHDNILQSVIGLNTLVSNLKGDQEIEGIVKVEFSKLIQSIRNEIFDTSPSTLYNLSLEENLQILIEDFNKKYPMISFTLVSSLGETIPKHLVAPVYRIIKEINENIGKHSEGTLGVTKISSNQQAIHLVITDDGIGISDYFQTEKNLIEARSHVGLLSIKNDVNWLNGTFEIITRLYETTGTKIEISIPIEKSDINENTIS